MDSPPQQTTLPDSPLSPRDMIPNEHPLEENNPHDSTDVQSQQSEQSSSPPTPSSPRSDSLKNASDIQQDTQPTTDSLHHSSTPPSEPIDLSNIPSDTQPMDTDQPVQSSQPSEQFLEISSEQSSNQPTDIPTDLELSAPDDPPEPIKQLDPSNAQESQDTLIKQQSSENDNPPELNQQPSEKQSEEPKEPIQREPVSPPSQSSEIRTSQLKETSFVDSKEPTQIEPPTIPKLVIPQPDDSIASPKASPNRSEPSVNPDDHTPRTPKHSHKTPRTPRTPKSHKTSSDTKPPEDEATSPRKKAEAEDPAAVDGTLTKSRSNKRLSLRMRRSHEKDLSEVKREDRKKEGPNRSRSGTKLLSLSRKEKPAEQKEKEKTPRDKPAKDKHAGVGKGAINVRKVEHKAAGEKDPRGAPVTSPRGPATSATAPAPVPKRGRSNTMWTSQTRKSADVVQIPKASGEVVTTTKMMDEMVTEMTFKIEEVHLVRATAERLVHADVMAQVTTAMKATTDALGAVRRSVEGMTVVDERYEQLQAFSGYALDVGGSEVKRFQAMTAPLVSFCASMGAFLEETKEVGKIEDEFKKIRKEYERLSGKVAEEKESGKTKGVMEAREEIISRGIKVGREALARMEEWLTRYYKMVLRFDGKMLGAEQKEGQKMKRRLREANEEKKSEWAGMSLDETTEDLSEWWRRDETIKRFFQNEIRYLNHLTLLIDRYYNNIANNPSLVLTGLALPDVDAMFVDSLAFVNLHKILLMQYKTANEAGILPILTNHLAAFYQLYHHFGIAFSRAMATYYEAKKNKIFHDAVRNINTIESARLKRLLREPVEYITQLRAIVPQITQADPRVTRKVIHVLDRLVDELDVARREFDADFHLAHIRDAASLDRVDRRLFFGVVPCVLNKVSGVVNVFSDVLIFSKRIEKESVDSSLVVKIVEIDRSYKREPRVVELRWAERIKGAEVHTADVFFKEETHADEFLAALAAVRHHLSKNELFGREISVAAIARHETLYIYPKLIHRFFDKCDAEAPSQEGVMRISTNVVELEKLIQAFDRGDEVDVEALNVHVIINALKKYCQRLPNKLPTELQDVPIDEHTTAEVQRILATIPPVYLAFIERLFRLMHLIYEQRETNLMGSDNIAIVISPNIYEDNDTFNPEKLKSTVRFMIEHYEEVFQEIRERVEQQLKENKDELRELEDLDAEIRAATFTELPTSTALTPQKEIALKDVLIQCEVECVDGKKVSRRWLVVFRHAVVVKKSADTWSAVAELPMKELVVKQTEKGVVLQADKKVTVVGDGGAWLAAVRRIKC